MSRAFVKEIDSDPVAFADRPISPHRNLVTEAGLAGIEAALDRFETDYRNALERGDCEGAGLGLRELRYWRARRSSAEVVKTLEDKSKASFGMTVILRRDDGRKQRFRIVGEDEADPARGTVSYMSPLARAVLTHSVGDTVTIAESEAVLLGVH